jgi:hypothetical protein
MNESSQAGAGPLEPSVRPCPFCGSMKGEDESGETYRWRRWRCECGATGPEVSCTITMASSRGGRDVREARRLAIEAWNDRDDSDLKAAKHFADLWYFVMDESPMAFEKIVCEHQPKRWMDEAQKLYVAKRYGA